MIVVPGETKAPLVFLQVKVVVETVSTTGIDERMSWRGGAVVSHAYDRSRGHPGKAA